MLNATLKKQHFREVLLFCFNQGKSAAVAHRLLVAAYGDNAPTEKSCREWFQRFKSGNFGVKDKVRTGRPKVFVDEELAAVLNENPCRTQEELALILHVDRTTVAKRLQTIGMIHKSGKNDHMPRESSSHKADIPICDNNAKRLSRKRPMRNDMSR